jgi:5'-3' exonuclease
MLLLLDLDLLVYRVGWTTLADPEGIAFWRMDEMIRGILEALQTDKYKGYLTASGKHYRHEIYPEYKANRKDLKKPTHYHRLRDYLLNVHGAELVIDQEADDALGIAQTQADWKENHPILGPITLNGYQETCIVSIDKDLDQIPGWHYNFVKQDLYLVTPEQGLRHFYHQLLMGDRIDNIPGIRGIGPVKARALLATCKNEMEMYVKVLEAYGGRVDDVLVRGRLLKIRTTEGEIWDVPGSKARSAKSIGSPEQTVV